MCGQVRYYLVSFFMHMSNIAVIRTGGKQYLVKTGDVLKVEKLASEGEVVFSDVLLVSDAKGEKVDVGTPKVSAQVKASVSRQGRAKKVRVVHFKPKVRQHKVYGHASRLYEENVHVPATGT